MSTGQGVQSVAESAAAKLNAGVPMHELTSAEWRAVAVEYQLAKFLEHGAGGPLPGGDR